MKFGRRSFVALASGLLLPSPEPVRVYSFMPGYRLIDREEILSLAAYPIIASRPWEPGLFGWFGYWLDSKTPLSAHMDSCRVHDYRESARVWGIPLRFA